MSYFKGYGAVVDRFCREYIIQTKGRWAGDPLSLEEWQTNLLDELYLVDGNGMRVYREALIGIPRKNGKSTMSAGIALHGLMAAGERGAEVYAAAGSKDQARIVFNQARDFVQASPKLKDWLKVTRDVIICESTGGIFRVLSSDGPLQHGLNPSLVVIDELWAHKDPELYYALTTGQLARENPLVVTITTAGWDRESIAWEVYSQMRALEKEGVTAMRNAQQFCAWYDAPADADIHDGEALMAANPASWITEKALQREANRLRPPIFRRLHMNQWTETEEAWLAPRLWEACAGDPEVNHEDPVTIAVDVGIKRDSAAVAIAQWHGDQVHIECIIRDPEDEGDTFGVADIRGLVGEMAGTYDKITEVAYDPWSFRESAEILEEAGVLMVEFPQSNARMAPATETLYELVRDERIVHDGDELLRAHILNAVIQATERGARISKRKSKARIDAAVAVAMAVERAVATHNVKPKGRKVAFL